MRTLLKKYGLRIAGSIAGAIGGYAYYHYVGCASGTCPITSNPYISVLYGALLGFLLFDMFKPKKNETN